MPRTDGATRTRLNFLNVGKPTGKNVSQKTNAVRKPPEIEVFFDVRDSGYWYRLNGRYLKLGSRDIRLHLRASHGLREDYCPTEWKAPNLREIDYPLWRSQEHAQIDYAGPLAGHRTGVFNNGGHRLLVTEEPAALWADYAKKPKRPTWFLQFVQELLPDDQWMHLLQWLRVALVSLRAGDFRPGQVPVFAGPGQCGKSLLQSIITEILGGRSASPFRYMMGETQFNYDLAGAEHWMIEDPASTTDIRTRRQFGAKLKEATVNRDFSIHQKGKDALLLPVFRRVTISVNDEPENLAVIPPLDASLADKLFLFKCDMANVGDDRKAIWATIVKEVPIIRAWLVNGLAKLPAEFKDNRFGVKAWHHPDLLAELANLSPETRLLGIIDDVLWGDVEPGEPLLSATLKSLDLEKRLRTSSFGFEVEKILKFSSACGTYLARLAKQLPERISKSVEAGYATWTIKPPAQEQKHES